MVFKVTARHKIKRLIIEHCEDSSKFRGNREKVNGAERLYAKKIVQYHLGEHEAQHNLDKDDEFSIEIELALWCWEQEKADPTYECKCPPSSI